MLNISGDKPAALTPLLDKSQAESMWLELQRLQHVHLCRLPIARPLRASERALSANGCALGVRGSVRLREGGSTHHHMVALMSTGVVLLSAMAELLLMLWACATSSPPSRRGGLGRRFVSSCLCASNGESSQATLVSTARLRRRRSGHGVRQSQAPGRFVSASMNS